MQYRITYKEKIKQYLKYIVIVPPILIMIDIFCFSVQPAEESSELSEGFAGHIIDLEKDIVGEEVIKSKRLELCEML